MEWREATAQDVDDIARLHAESWRRHYRGAYSDAFLDGEVVADRMAVWRERLIQPEPDCYTLIARQDGALAGFAHTILNDDPTWGALLDNLHVRHDLKGHGLGSRLMARTAKVVLERTTPPALYLWVLERNTAAQAFYQARGGTRVGRNVSDAPGGGTIAALRYVWPDPAALLVTGEP
jgi:GNAT superfamily N-acetyltransferase